MKTKQKNENFLYKEKIIIFKLIFRAMYVLKKKQFYYLGGLRFIEKYNPNAVVICLSVSWCYVAICGGHVNPCWYEENYKYVLLWEKKHFHRVLYE